MQRSGARQGLAPSTACSRRGGSMEARWQPDIPTRNKARQHRSARPVQGPAAHRMRVLKASMPPKVVVSPPGSASSGGTSGRAPPCTRPTICRRAGGTTGWLETRCRQAAAAGGLWGQTGQHCVQCSARLVLLAKRTSTWRARTHREDGDACPGQPPRQQLPQHLQQCNDVSKLWAAVLCRSSQLES